jgi:hypothetical protein
MHSGDQYHAYRPKARSSDPLTTAVVEGLLHVIMVAEQRLPLARTAQGWPSG